jgi:hypothetical protein
MNTSPSSVNEDEMPDKAQQSESDGIRRALLDAEAACPRALPLLTADDLLAAACRRRSKSLKTRSTIAATAVVAVTLALVRLSTSPESPIEPRAGSVSARSDLHAEIAGLEREAAIHQQVARQLMRDRHLVEQEHEAAGDAPVLASLIAAQEDSRSAAISLQYASIVEQESPDPERAKQEYERVAQRFPGTTWAALAAASVERLSTARFRSEL